MYLISFGSQKSKTKPDFGLGRLPYSLCLYTIYFCLFASLQTPKTPNAKRRVSASAKKLQMTPTLRLRKKLCETVERNVESDFSAEGDTSDDDSDDDSVCSGSYRNSRRKGVKTTPKVG